MKKGWRKNRGCDVPNCDKPHKSRGYCAPHYVRFSTHGTARPEKKIMAFPERSKKERKDCNVLGCAETAITKGYCDSHYARLRKHGDVMQQKPIGDGYGERHFKSNGYVVIRNKCEHVLVAEKVLGRNLKTSEHVHHVNGVRNDNRPRNLVICQDQKYHMLLHRRMRALKACGHAS